MRGIEGARYAAGGGIVRDELRQASIAALQSGQTPLATAAAQGHVDSMRMLLDTGAALEARDEVCPSVGGCGYCRVSSVWALGGAAIVTRGLSTPCWSGHGARSAHRASACRGQALNLSGAWVLGRLCSATGVVATLSHTLFAPQSGWGALLWAASNGHVDAIALLLDRGANAEAKDDVRLSVAQRRRRSVSRHPSIAG